MLAASRSLDDEFVPDVSDVALPGAFVSDDDDVLPPIDELLDDAPLIDDRPDGEALPADAAPGGDASGIGVAPVWPVGDVALGDDGLDADELGYDGSSAAVPGDAVPEARERDGDDSLDDDSLDEDELPDASASALAVRVLPLPCSACQASNS